jgi:hypothetical protein
MMNAVLDFDPDDDGIEDLLIQDYEFSGPAALESVFIDALANYALTIGKKGIVINSTDENTESLLEQKGCDIVERFEEAGLVTGVLELPDESRTTEEKALADLDAVAEIVDHAQAEFASGDLNGLKGSVDAIDDRASVWSDPA